MCVKTGLLQASWYYSGSTSEAQAELSKAGEKLQNLLNAENEIDSDSDEETNQDNNNIVDVTVSFDGTLAKRGFTFGVFFVMSVDTGEVLDYHIFSKFYQKCSKKKNECKDDLEEFEAWKVEHIVNRECDINFEGCSLLKLKLHKFSGIDLLKNTK